ncbi:hypothetical protein ELS17_16390 [Natrinema altunense]|uniref:Uncharacterized protein n=1 Tax=Natrinema altunense TaxID=222984 RepID=A0A482XXF4_9EURY|nr:hypothetical protein ELS17_16390 [Natrinema altunense]
MTRAVLNTVRDSHGPEIINRLYVFGVDRPNRQRLSAAFHRLGSRTTAAAGPGGGVRACEINYTQAHKAAL